MIITCPACATHFTLHASALGRAGRQVRCFNCGHEWAQRPVAESRLVSRRVAARPKPQAAAPVRRAAAPAPAPQYMPEVAPQAAAEDDALEAAMARAAAASESRPRPQPQPAQPGPDDDRIAAALAREADPETLASFGGPSGSAPANETLENLDEPEPIPEVLMSEPNDAMPDKPARSGPGAIMGWVGGVVILFLIGGGMFYGRDFIVGLWPAANSVYAMVGLGGDVLGSGL